jgi:hypothetical protein
VTRRALFTIAVLTAVVTVSAAAQAEGTGASGRVGAPGGPTGASFQPDGWIQLCGQSLGCVIDPPPHPWRGKNVYNTNGRNQTLTDDINEGEGIRYWIAIQNDGSATDTFEIQGCRGNRTYEINKVLLGKHTRQDPSAEDLTSRYMRGTLTFEIDPGKKVVFTVNIITHFNKNVTYRCITEFQSVNDQSSRDVVVAEMTTF